MAPIVAGPKGPQNGAAYAIGGWEDDWTQLATFNFGGSPSLLLYKGNKGSSNNAYVASIVAGPKGPQNGNDYAIGGWEDDWTQVTCFEADNSASGHKERFCGVPDTAPQTSGSQILAYGSPLGLWAQGNLTVNINVTGVKGVSPAQASTIIFSAYQAYQAVQPFFNFVLGGPGSNINVQFGGTSLNPTLGITGGAIGIGAAPPAGNLFFDSGTTWTPALLLAVALHEAGHTLGLSHSTNPAAVMCIQSRRR